jgi:hypothetical protein
VAQLTAAGARLVSLNPLRETLEDFFVKRVSAPEVMAARRGLEPAKTVPKAS